MQILLKFTQRLSFNSIKEDEVCTEEKKVNNTSVFIPMLIISAHVMSFTCVMILQIQGRAQSCNMDQLVFLFESLRAHLHMVVMLRFMSVT